MYSTISRFCRSNGIDRDSYMALSQEIVKMFGFFPTDSDLIKVWDLTEPLVDRTTTDTTMTSVMKKINKIFNTPD